MTWNWQQKEWPEFKYDVTYLAQFEEQFLHQSGVIFGAYKHLKDEDQTALKVSVASDEALKTSEIEGEYLNRDSLQCSIRKNFGSCVSGRTEWIQRRIERGKLYQDNQNFACYSNSGSTRPGG